ncbi:TIGR03621 family F420-dependent LLM class oxidoreductase [Actinopolymorpha rutila]|uniref:Putative F420-dependent oxidoreductase n=1 Tax=Actinopolymorpha rutila TaxID=446787 RepID=A0A852ZA04_9ACTN|nr:TIGR03621 family F420-dependent LLM class oxidoreductase [Actinopolymorpha rutila]NYH89173.1 putative F420-dependent oxidoreductase [Actinopolymorpha rutila]
MAVNRRFRFGTGSYTTANLAEFQDNARRVETLGYDIFLSADHFNQDMFPVGPGLVAAACATTTLRLGSFVYCNNFRHPALLAREAAAIDVLSGGRLEFGIGAGYYQVEYDQTGITLPDRRTRIDSLREALAIVKGLWADEPFTFDGEHYTITEMEGWPKPLQRPRPPVHIGGAGRRIMKLAASEADVVGILAPSLTTGLALGDETDAGIAQSVGWLRDAAGERFDDIELGALIWYVMVTDHPESAAEVAASRWGVSAEQVLASPYFLLGSVEGIIEQVQALGYVTASAT